jgi:hypothetical protein
VLRAGRAWYGAEPLVTGLLGGGDALRVDGRPRVLARGLGRRAASISRAHPRARDASWMSGLELGTFD